MSVTYENVRIYKRALSDSDVMSLYNYEQNPIPQNPVTNGLVAYYPFNGDANDASGNGKNGTANSVTSASDRFGFLNNAFAFNGTNSYIWMGTQVRPPVLSASAWFQTGVITNSFGTQTILRDRFNGWSIYVQANESNTGFITADINRIDGSLVRLWATNAAYNDGLWHMATLTYDGYTGGLYVDGILQQSTTLGTYSSINFQPGGLAVGRDGDFSGSYFQGNIDEVRIYNRALSSNEVLQLYAYEPPCLPHRATATAQLFNGVVSGVTMTDGGCGYTNAPIVLIQGGGGSGATATAVVSNGVVVSINITASGNGYTSNPNAYIYSPLGLQIGLLKAVKPAFSDLLIGTNYQLQVSGDLVTWTNQNSPFTPTNPSMVYTQYFDVDNWPQLFFRLQTTP